VPLLRRCRVAVAIVSPCYLPQADLTTATDAVDHMLQAMTACVNVQKVYRFPAGLADERHESLLHHQAAKDAL
jgi:hypothetical protein